jgi:hypothetical protein
MTHILRSALWALVLVTLAVGAAYAMTYRIEPRWLWIICFAPVMPAWVLVLFFGLGSGPHGVPVPSDAFPFLLTFLVLWIAFIIALPLPGSSERDAGFGAE